MPCTRCFALYPAAFVLAIAPGCASPTIVSSNAPQAKATAPLPSPNAVAAPTPDELLRARLDAVMEENDAIRANRRAASSLISNPPNARIGGTMVSGRLAPEQIQTVIRSNFSKLRRCYEVGLKKNANLSGRVSIRFVIERDGGISHIGSKDSDLPDQSVVNCILKAFETLKFPEPEGGIVTVVYPIMFSPGDDSSTRPANTQPPKPPEPPALPPEAPPPAPRPPSPSARPTDATMSGPVVVIEGSKVMIEGVVVGEIQSIIDADRMTKVDGLFQDLKAWRETWKIMHPEKPFTGAVGLRVDSDIPQVAFKSVFQTMAFAGYPDIFVQSATEPTQISEFIAQVPAPPDPSGPPEPESVLHLAVSQEQVTLTWKRAASVLDEKPMARRDASLTTSICDSWKTFGRHPEAIDSRRDVVVLRGENALSWKDVAEVARSVESCKREVQQPDGRKENVPIFWTIFSVL